MSALSDKHVLAVSERSAAVWEYSSCEEAPRRKARRSFAYAPRAASHVRHGEVEEAAPTGGETSIPEAGAPGSAGPAQKEFYYQYTNGRESNHSGGVREAAVREKDASSLWMGLGDSGDVKKVLNIKNMPDSAFTASTLMLPALEVRSSSMNSNMSQDKGMGSSSKPQHVLYCVAGHKLYAGTLPSYDKHNREMIHMGNNAIVDVSSVLIFCIRIPAKPSRCSTISSLLTLA